MGHLRKVEFNVRSLLSFRLDEVLYVDQHLQVDARQQRSVDEAEDGRSEQEEGEDKVSRSVAILQRGARSVVDAQLLKR